ncbi:N-acetylmuramoyl-L-alanine amidase, partial [Clostridium perfringens]|nr:N-acetylmuramoyl-L-alanine amidase [Clostridium perfringens]
MSKLILIDCGHCLSGADTGAIGLGYREEVLTRQIGERTKNILEKAG